MHLKDLEETLAPHQYLINVAIAISSTNTNTIIIFLIVLSKRRSLAGSRSEPCTKSSVRILIQGPAKLEALQLLVECGAGDRPFSLATALALL
jgi:hypothetical protein